MDKQYFEKPFGKQSQLCYKSYLREENCLSGVLSQLWSNIVTQSPIQCCGFRPGEVHVCHGVCTNTEPCTLCGWQRQHLAAEGD